MEERFHTFTLLVSNISRYIRKIKSFEMAEYNLKAPHVSCLYYLYKCAPITARELCDICDEDKGAVSRSLEFLEKSGYVRRESEGKRKYKVPLYLTEEGKKIGAEVVEKIDNVLQTVGRDMTDAERESFYRTLLLIADELKKITDEYEHSKGKNNG